ncbi:MAG: hypothetical protein DDG60_04705 [Anaerolineae bacterium]|nr:MAG: hypothetical protein DDG60_04705 [Anaerolineae bacterium]
MKLSKALFLVLLLALFITAPAHAQSAESIWLAANTTTYKTGDTVIVTVNAISATPIQGFTFQIRYDPACLRPVNAASTIPGMNGLPLPQLSGQVDGSYASTIPQLVNGVLAEVRFIALRACETNLVLESAALAIRNQSGFAAPLAGITLGQTSIPLAVSMEKGGEQEFQPISGAILPLDPPVASQKSLPTWVIGLVSALMVLGIMGGFALLRKKPTAPAKQRSLTRQPRLQIKRGPHAGKMFVLQRVPCLIGSDPRNDICLEDPGISGHHAKIFSSNNAFYLTDLSGNTFINGQPVRRASAPLRPGDVVRLGKSALFVFEA